MCGWNSRLTPNYDELAIILNNTKVSRSLISIVIFILYFDCYLVIIIFWFVNCQLKFHSLKATIEKNEQDYMQVFLQKPRHEDASPIYPTEVGRRRQMEYPLRELGKRSEIPPRWSREKERKYPLDGVCGEGANILWRYMYTYHIFFIIFNIYH